MLTRKPNRLRHVIRKLRTASCATPGVRAERLRSQANKLSGLAAVIDAARRTA